jgi:cytosine/adenosine deaminase-related metal-dependent hydrolase
MSVSPVVQTGDTTVTVINGARYATGPQTAVYGSLEVVAGRLQGLHSDPATLPTSANEIDLEGFLLLPGLINAHDHLQYALHPRMGQPPYRNYVEWGDDIHASLSTQISHYKSVPKNLRLWWGGIRNLLSGVTTVCHHDPFWPALQANDYPIKVVRDYGWAHSIRLDPDIRRAWSDTEDGFPFFVHACEGTDELAREELVCLDRLQMLNARTVVIHGLALDEFGIELLQERQASLILCPSSNQFLYDQLPDMKNLIKVKNVALGNDSPLTAMGDLLDEVRFAIEHAALPAESAYRMITDVPAAILRLKNGEGHIRESGCADFVAVRDNGESLEDRLPSLSWRDIEFVMIAGEVRLASEYVLERLPLTASRGMEPLWMDGHVRWLRAPVRQLVEQAEAFLGAGMLRLGGRVVRLVDPVIPGSSSLISPARTRREERL